MIFTKTHPASRTFTNVFDELFNNFPAAVENATSSTAAPVNIHESENGYHLAFNVPGRNKEDFKINLDKGLLTVSFEKREEAEAKEMRSVRKEFSFRNFKRSFTLDEKVNADGIEAAYINGILNIYLPKKEEVKVAPKEITIQ